MEKPRALDTLVAAGQEIVRDLQIASRAKTPLSSAQLQLAASARTELARISGLVDEITTRRRTARMALERAVVAIGADERRWANEVQAPLAKLQGELGALFEAATR